MAKARKRQKRGARPKARVARPKARVAKVVKKGKKASGRMVRLSITSAPMPADIASRVADRLAKLGWTVRQAKKK